tara:strand:+ start:11204 stop:11806 length:603 start_codon:yes stop_codon:yes gene_type:complete
MTTTNLTDLPVSSVSGPEQNVEIKVTEQNTVVPNSINKIEQQQTTQQTTQQKDTIDFNSIITGIQNAAANGSLELPSRDIPQTQSHLTNDTQIAPNYIPNDKNDYIESSYNQNEVINQNVRKENKNTTIDNLYDDIHIPIILAVIYFVFQLPVIKKNTFKYIPSLFSNDGNYNFMGFVVTSVAFASTYQIIIKSIEYLTI